MLSANLYPTISHHLFFFAVYIRTWCNTAKNKKFGTTTIKYLNKGWIYCANYVLYLNRCTSIRNEIFVELWNFHEMKHNSINLGNIYKFLRPISIKFLSFIILWIANLKRGNIKEFLYFSTRPKIFCSWNVCE